MLLEKIFPTKVWIIGKKVLENYISYPCLLFQGTFSLFKKVPDHTSSFSWISNGVVVSNNSKMHEFGLTTQKLSKTVYKILHLSPILVPRSLPWRLITSPVASSRPLRSIRRRSAWRTKFELALYSYWALRASSSAILNEWVNSLQNQAICLFYFHFISSSFLVFSQTFQNSPTRWIFVYVQDADTIIVVY